MQRVLLPLGCLLGFLLLSAAAARADLNLVDVNQDFDVKTVKTHNAKVSVVDKTLLVETNRDDGQAGVVFTAPAGGWDLSAFQDVAVEVKNVGRNPLTVGCRVDNPGANGAERNLRNEVTLAPDEKKTLRVFVTRRIPRELRSKFFGMRGVPNQVWTPGIDPTKIAQVVIFVPDGKEEHRFELSYLRARQSSDDAALVAEKDFFPMIDAYGQYIHKDWPGKIHKSSDFAARKAEEDADLAAHPGPKDRDKWGGWTAGPKLQATGFFRTEKINGKWWLVDPDGRLFWSNGITCVNAHNAGTPISDRKHWYADLPKAGSPLAQFYGKGRWGHRNYHSGQPCEDYNFGLANQLRKYGPDWRDKFPERACQRLLSWGISTIAVWSDNDVYRQHKLPYVTSTGSSSRPLAVSDGWWGRFWDVFDPSFPAAAKEQMERHRNGSANDPWCIGYCSDNEMSWGSDGMSLAITALRSPADQPIKLAFVDDLKKKYKTIDKLNEVWDTKHASWDALLQSTAPPNKFKARADLEAFYARIADRYFHVVRDAIKAVAPHQLYLGCRFANFGQNAAAIRAATKYCDVVSFNVYKHATDLPLPEGFDKPIVIGEFHFGALDRGMFHTGLAGTSNQEERAQAYKKYVEGALDNPFIVGTHWFQFMDQATTGRGDGENYQIGFVDSCDTPNPEIIQAAREIGDEMYPRRFGK